MLDVKNVSYEPWPLFSYQEFKSTGHLLHMAVQAIGKLKLNTPFEPHWSNVVLELTSRGLTTGLIPYAPGVFSIDIDLIEHRMMITTSWDGQSQFDITSMSVAQLVEKLFSTLRALNIEMKINMMPQEIPSPIPFDQDTQQQNYDKNQANAWWRILVSSYQVMQRYRARFNGETPFIGLMWGTFDLRDARYNGIPVATTGINAGYIRRNAMNEEHIEAGWWAGSEAYPRPAYYSFTYPQPEKIEDSQIKPVAARWEKALSVFILDYDDLIKSQDPAKDLLAFLESTYEVGARLAGWNPNLLMSGKPV